MSSRPLVDPQLVAALEQFPGFQLTNESLGAMRAMLTELVRPSAAGSNVSDVSTTERRVPGPRGAPDVRIMIFSPNTDTVPRPAFLHIHGGGYVMGSPDMTAENSIALAREIGCVVVSVDYSLAPETRFPGPLEDCYAALKWLHQNARELGVDPKRIAIGGESAGGGLAAALALIARDRREIPIVFQLLIYPMIDDRTVTRSDLSAPVGEFVWTRENNRFGWEALLGLEPGSETVSQYAAAARAETFRGLPPTFISVGSLDLFLEEDIVYATKLLSAGVPTELHVYPGAYHGFEMVPDADVTKLSIGLSRAALARALKAH